ncbi:hypothetical protein [Spartinivicinus ruber]|uniref:hypothetical protein n=1 Tax=Spartinivicinus ruber TaxID=2683272 RepID=UPI0013D2F586|nr:hypothetical protein [Spartinivicinus ruber]
MSINDVVKPARVSSAMTEEVNTACPIATQTARLSSSTQHQAPLFSHLIRQIDQEKASLEKTTGTVSLGAVKPSQLREAPSIPHTAIYQIADEINYVFKIYQQIRSKEEAAVFPLSTQKPALSRYFLQRESNTLICKSLPNDPIALARVLNQLIKFQNNTTRLLLFTILGKAIKNTQGQLSHYLAIDRLGHIQPRTIKPISYIPQTKQEQPTKVNYDYRSQPINRSLTRLINTIRHKSDVIIKQALIHDYYVTLNNRLAQAIGFHVSGLSLMKTLHPTCQQARLGQSLDTQTEVDMHCYCKDFLVGLNLERQFVDQSLNALLDKLAYFEAQVVNPKQVATLQVDALTACQQAKQLLAKINPKEHHQRTKASALSPYHAFLRMDHLLSDFQRLPDQFKHINDRPFTRALVAAELNRCVDCLPAHPTFLGKAWKWAKSQQIQAFEQLLEALGYEAAAHEKQR